MTYSHSPRLFPNLLQLLRPYGAEDDLGAPEYGELEYRQANARHIQDVVRRFYKTRPKQQLFEEAQEAGLRWMPVNGVAEIAQEPFLNARDWFRQVDGPDGRKMKLPGVPFQFRGMDLKTTSAAPAHGQHNLELFETLTEHASPDGKVAPRAASSQTDPPEQGPWLPLKGIRVLDFSWLIAGPLGTRLLANYGAEVLKVESYNRVDGIRLTGPHPDTAGPVNVNEDGSFNDVNLGKKSILLNLNAPEAREVALKLAAVSDIVAANFTGDRLPRWGLGFDDLRKVKPDIIFLSMPVFDGDGPRRRWGGVGSDISAISGINAISGFEGEPPVGLGLHYPDFSSNPFHAQAAILAALVNRNRFGRAQFIEVSQFESTASLLGPALLAYFANGIEPERLGNHSDRYSPHNVYRCAGEDSWIALSASDQSEWRSLCLAIDHAEWLEDPRFATLEARKRNEAALDTLISEAVKDRDSGALASQLQRRGAAAAPVRNLADLMADPWYREQYFSEMTGPDGCVFTAHGEPMRPFGLKQGVTRAPAMGEHTEEVLRAILGYGDEEMNKLYVAGALG